MVTLKEMVTAKETTTTTILAFKFFKELDLKKIRRYGRNRFPLFGFH
jgi:hypothetical protein